MTAPNCNIAEDLDARPQAIYLQIQSKLPAETSSTYQIYIEHNVATCLPALPHPSIRCLFKFTTEASFLEYFR